METLLIALYFIFFSFLSKRNITWGVYLVLFTLPAYLIRFSIGHIPLTLLEGEIIIIFLMWVWNQRRRIKSKCSVTRLLSTHALAVPTLLFIASAIMSTLISPDLRAALGILKAYFFEPIAFFIVLVTTFKKNDVVPLMWALSSAMIIPGVLALYQHETGWMIPNIFWQAEATRRVTSVYGYPNAIGLFFAPLCAGIIAVLVQKMHSIFNPYTTTDTKKMLCLKISLLSLMLALGILSILFARSKGALLGVAAGVVLYAVLWRGRRLLFASMLLLGLMITPLVGITKIKNFFISNPSTISGGTSAEVRIEQWRETGEMLQKSPLFGAGIAGYQERVKPYHKKTYIEIFLYPHNLILALWSETGLLGLLSFLWIIIIFFKITFNSWRADTRAVEIGQQSNATTTYQAHVPMALMGAMIALLAHGLVDVPYFKNDLSVLFWTLISLTVMYAGQHHHSRLILPLKQ